MSDNYFLYDPAIFGATEIKEDTRNIEILRLRAENEKLRAELDEYKRNGIVDVTGSINYHSGYDDGVKNERERCVMIIDAIEPLSEPPCGSVRSTYRNGYSDGVDAAAAALKGQSDE